MNIYRHASAAIYTCYFESNLNHPSFIDQFQVDFLSTQMLSEVVIYRLQLSDFALLRQIILYLAILKLRIKFRYLFT